VTGTGLPVRWGILGAGRIVSGAVGPALAATDRAVVVAVGSHDPERAAAVAPAATRGGYGDVVADPDVEVVYIALTNDAHVPWALRAVRAGKHVLCEKPLGVRAEEVEVLLDAAADAGVEVVEASWYRWHPRTRHAEALVAGGDLGEVVDVRAGFSFSGVPAGDYRLDPERGGGAVYDVGCYALSAVGWATRWAALEVVGVEQLGHVGGVDLHVTARCRAGTATAEVRASIDGPDAQWIEVVGSRGTLRFSPPAFTAWTAGAASLEVEEATTGRSETRTFPACNPYRSMVDAVSDRVRGRDAWVVPGSESLWVARAVDAILARFSPR
jgi:xylose dehydrogenase (NAD/NADP)